MLDPITPSTESEIEFKREVKHSLNADMPLQTRKRNCCGVPEFFQPESAHSARTAGSILRLLYVFQTNERYFCVN